MAGILIIDDDTFICKAIQKQLNNNGFNADVAFSGSSGLKMLKQKKFDLVLCDFRLPDMDGLEVLNELKKTDSQTPVVIITAYADVRMAVKLMKQGAFDYITKPLQHEEIVSLVKKISLGRETHANYFPLNNDFITGISPAFKQAVKYAQKVAPTNISVLLEGETGTGKEYIARFIHEQSHKSANPFIAVDCGAIPKELANSELFGHVKGSFTGAVNNKTGLFQQANGGTLFLDEVGNLGYGVQVRLLRALQEKVITRLGENNPIKVDVRIIAATNENLQGQVLENHFRDDLLHRLNEFKIVLPPLRERKEDIDIFVGHFLEMANKELGLGVNKIDPETRKIFHDYEWPGNIRELKNVVRRSVLLSTGDTLTPDLLPAEIIVSSAQVSRDENYKPDGYQENRLKNASSNVEKQIIIKAIEDAGFNKSKAARALNIDRTTLYNKLKQYGIGF